MTLKFGYTVTKAAAVQRETPLQSAIRKLQEDDSKVTHLEPAERNALREALRVMDNGSIGG